jgi:AraC-like DNA-binding protein
MDPTLLDRKSHLNISFLLSHNKGSFLKVWHFHEELELVAITKSTGTRFIGDNMEKFEPGDLVLIGENLPHLWQNDDKYFRDSLKGKPEALVIHFSRHFAGEQFLSMPEMTMISELINNADQGIRFSRDTAKRAVKTMKRMLRMDHFSKVIELIKLLKELSHEKEKQYLSSPGFIQSLKSSKKKKLDEVYKYIMGNFQKTLSLDQLANIASMNKSAFCRYFKITNGKTLTEYINEVRIGYACKLLLEEKFTVSEISDRCGFNNLSNFNRRFKSITKFSPSAYLKKYNINVNP